MAGLTSRLQAAGAGPSSQRAARPHSPGRCYPAPALATVAAAPSRRLAVGAAAERRGGAAGDPPQTRRTLPATRAVAAPLRRSSVPGPLTAPHPAHTPRPSPSQQDTDLQAAVAAVRLASSLAQAAQLRLTEGEQLQKAGDASPVTVADFGAQALVAWSLQQALPHQRLSLVAEEDAASLRAPEGAPLLGRVTRLVNDTLGTLPATPHLAPSDVLDLIDCGSSAGGPSGRHWILDPIDGTRGFVGGRQYAVCLALLEDGEVTLGVLGCPNLPHDPLTDEHCGPEAARRSMGEGVGSLFAARRGLGAHEGPLWGRGLPRRRLLVKDGQRPEQVQYMGPFERRHSNQGVSGRVAATVGLNQQPLRLDSQAKYGALARGDAGVFMRFPPPTYKERPWDVAAGALIVEEAGGRVTDAAGKPLDFSRGRHVPLSPAGRPGIVAAVPSVHAAILRALQQ